MATQIEALTFSWMFKALLFLATGVIILRRKDYQDQ